MIRPSARPTLRELIYLRAGAVHSERWCRARGYKESAEHHKSAARNYLWQCVVRIVTLGVL